MSKQTTSAVEGMTVSDMRKLLAESRSMLVNQTVEQPFSINQKLSNNESIWEFSVKVALGIHGKRTKTKKI